MTVDHDPAAPVGHDPEHQVVGDVTSPTRRVVYHFSEDGTIEHFVPRPAPSDPAQPAGVRAVGADHAPLYWFPRHCPRVSVWASTRAHREVLRERFGTDAVRICAVESAWLDRIRACELYRYEFDMASFRPEDQPGHFVAIDPVEPIARVRLDDLLGMHAAAGVELRLAPKLVHLVDQILAAGLPYHIVRLRDIRR